MAACARVGAVEVERAHVGDFIRGGSLAASVTVGGFLIEVLQAGPKVLEEALLSLAAARGGLAQPTRYGM